MSSAHLSRTTLIEQENNLIGFSTERFKDIRLRRLSQRDINEWLIEIIHTLDQTLTIYRERPLCFAYLLIVLIIRASNLEDKIGKII